MARIIRKTERPNLDEVERVFIMMAELIGRKNGNNIVTQKDIVMTPEGVGDIVKRLSKRGLLSRWISNGVLQFSLSDEAAREASRWLGGTGTRV